MVDGGWRVIVGWGRGRFYGLTQRGGTCRREKKKRKERFEEEARAGEKKERTG
jgi:hypothetical protein